jgi:hypothetical protein
MHFKLGHYRAFELGEKFRYATIVPGKEEGEVVSGDGRSASSTLTSGPLSAQAGSPGSSDPSVFPQAMNRERHPAGPPQEWLRIIRHIIPRHLRAIPFHDGAETAPSGRLDFNRRDSVVHWCQELDDLYSH